MAKCGRQSKTFWFAMYFFDQKNIPFKTKKKVVKVYNYAVNSQLVAISALKLLTSSLFALFLNVFFFFQCNKYLK